jgi:hypothetical protein
VEWVGKKLRLTIGEGMRRRHDPLRFQICEILGRAVKTTLDTKPAPPVLLSLPRE